MTGTAFERAVEAVSELADAFDCAWIDEPKFVRAVLLAIREPDEGMVGAADAVDLKMIEGGEGPLGGYSFWQIYIDHLLTEG